MHTNHPGDHADTQVLIQQAQGGTWDSAFHMHHRVLKLLRVWDHSLSGKGLEVLLAQDTIKPALGEKTLFQHVSLHSGFRTRSAFCWIISTSGLEI